MTLESESFGTFASSPLSQSRLQQHGAHGLIRQLCQRALIEPDDKLVHTWTRLKMQQPACCRPSAESLLRGMRDALCQHQLLGGPWESAVAHVKSQHLSS